MAYTPTAFKGFRYAYNLAGELCPEPVYRDYICKDTETLTKGDLVNLETGEIDLAVSNDTALLGLCLETKAGTDSTTAFKIIDNPLAVYVAYDTTARTVGADLDISGTTGSQAIAADSDHDVVCVANTAYLTYFIINQAVHPYAKGNST